MHVSMTILCTKDKRTLENCPKCGYSRWKMVKQTKPACTFVHAKILPNSGRL